MEFYHLYPSLFQDLLNQDYETDSYIGQGNPSSEILIIGKECAGIGQNYEFVNNAKIWKTVSPENIENWFDANWDWKKYLGKLKDR